MQRRSFLLGTLSTATIILTGRRSAAAEIETWRSYNTGRFEEIRAQLAMQNSRWIDIDLRRMKVTGLQGNQIISHQRRQLIFLCDDGDLHNPTYHYWAFLPRWQCGKCIHVRDPTTPYGV